MKWICKDDVIVFKINYQLDNGLDYYDKKYIKKIKFVQTDHQTFKVTTRYLCKSHVQVDRFNDVIEIGDLSQSTASNKFIIRRETYC